MRARQLIEKITVLRHSLFTKNLMERLPSPLLPGSLARRASSKSPAVGHRIGYLTEDWLHWASIKRHASWCCCSAAALVLFIVLKYVIARLTDRRQRADRGAAALLLRAGQVGGMGGAAARAAGHRRGRARSTAGSMRSTCCFRPWARAAPAVLKADRAVRGRLAR